MAKKVVLYSLFILVFIPYIIRATYINTETAMEVDPESILIEFDNNQKYEFPLEDLLQVSQHLELLNNLLLEALHGTSTSFETKPTIKLHNILPENFRNFILFFKNVPLTTSSLNFNYSFGNIMELVSIANKLNSRPTLNSFFRQLTQFKVPKYKLLLEASRLLFESDRFQPDENEIYLDTLNVEQFSTIIKFLYQVGRLGLNSFSDAIKNENIQKIILKEFSTWAFLSDYLDMPVVKALLKKSIFSPLFFQMIQRNFSSMKNIETIDQELKDELFFYISKKIDSIQKIYSIPNNFIPTSIRSNINSLASTNGLQYVPYQITYWSRSNPNKPIQFNFDKSITGLTLTYHLIGAILNPNTLVSIDLSKNNPESKQSPTDSSLLTTISSTFDPNFIHAFSPLNRFIYNVKLNPYKLIQTSLPKKFLAENDSINAATLEKNMIVIHSNNQLRLYNLTNAAINIIDNVAQPILPLEVVKISDTIYRIAVAYDNQIVIYNSNNPNPFAIIKNIETPIALALDSEYVAAFTDYKIIVWDYISQREVAHFISPLDSSYKILPTISFSSDTPDNQTIFFGCSNSTIVSINLSPQSVSPLNSLCIHFDTFNNLQKIFILLLNFFALNDELELHSGWQKVYESFQDAIKEIFIRCGPKLIFKNQ